MPPPAGTAFQHHRIADAGGFVHGRLGVGQQAGAREHGQAGLPRQFAGGVFQPEIPQMFWRGADEGDALCRQALGKGDAFGEETVAGMHGLRAGRMAGGDDGVDVEVALGRRCRTDRHRLVRGQDGGGEAVGLGIHRDGEDIQFFEGAADAKQDFAAIGDEDLAEHQPAETMMRMGVGRKPLQGLFTCGQLEISTRTSILGAQFHIAAGLRDAVIDGQLAVRADGDVHEEVDVGDKVALVHAVSGKLGQEVFPAGMHEAGFVAEADGVALAGAGAGAGVVKAAAIGDEA